MTISNVKRILVVKLADLGDVLICEPAIRSLRLAYPSSDIDVLVTPSSSSVVELIGHGTCAIQFPKDVFDSPVAFADSRNTLRAFNLAHQLRSHSYDLIVILHHLTTTAGAAKFRALCLATGAAASAGLDNGRGTFLTHRVTDRGFGAQHETGYMLAVARAAGGVATDPAPRISVPTLMPSFDLPEQYVCVYPATGPFSSARAWPASRYAEVARSLSDQGVSVVIVGATDAAEAAHVIHQVAPDAIDVTGQTSLEELTMVVNGAAAVIGGDSFIGHLAAALDRPAVSIFGPSNVDAWMPFGSVEWNDGRAMNQRRIAVRHPLPCAPCIYSGYSLGRPHGCPTRTCLTMVTVESVVAATRQVLEADRSWETGK